MFMLWAFMGNKAELTAILTAMKVELRQQKVTQYKDLFRTIIKIKWSFDIFSKNKRVSAFNWECLSLFK